MDFNIDVRRKQLNSLDQFIKSSRENFESILKSLSWTESAVGKDESMVTCTINPEHKVPNHSLKKHVEECTLRQEKYNNCSHLLSTPSHHKQASIFLSDEQKVKLFSDAVKNNKEFKTVWKCDQPVPKSADRIYCTHSPDERLVLYEHCVASTTGPENLPDFNIFKLYKNPTGSPLTADEERARERDLKRRSFKYKKTFTNHDRDPVEVMREVIDGQMELYREWLVARDQNSSDPHVDRELEHNDDVTAMNNRKGPRTPEHEAPADVVDYNGNGRYNEVEELIRRDSRHSSRTRAVQCERSRSPRRRRSREDQKPQRRRHQSHSRSRSPRGGGRNSSQHHYTLNQRGNGDKSRDRSRDKRKSHSSRHSDGGGSNGKRRERTRSRSPRSGRSRR